MRQAAASVVLFIHVFFLLGGLSAQETKKYEGASYFGETLFDASFEFYTEDRDTVYHGNFFLNLPIEDHEWGTPFDFLTVKGRFKRGKVDGTWNLSTGTFEPSGIPRYENYKYIVPVGGVEWVTKAQFDKGIRTGTWKVFEWKVADSETTDTILKAEFTFSKDEVFGLLKLETEDHVLIGEIGEDECADGDWMYYGKGDEGESELLEKWVFREKRLIEKVFYRSEGDEVTFKVYPDSLPDAELEMVGFTKKGFDILKLEALLSDPEAYAPFKDRDRFEDFFVGTVGMILDADSILFQVANKEVSIPIKTEVYKYPYSRGERRTFRAVRKQVDDISELINSVADDPQINLAKISTPEVAWYTGVLSLIDERYVKPLNTTLDLFDSGTLEYVDRNRYIDRMIDFDKELVGTASKQDTTIKVDYSFKSFDWDDSDAPLDKFEKLAAGLVDEIEAINDSLEFYIFEIRKEEELTGIEAELYEKFEMLQQLADSLLPEQIDDLAGFDLSEPINDFLKERISEYAKIEGSKVRMEEAEKLLECMSKVEELLYTLENSLENYYATRDAYQRQVFNPYTYTYMEETMKPTIYKAFEKVLLPALYKNTKRLKCEKIDTEIQNFDKLFQGMNDILNTDTRRKQRQVKRKSDPEEVSGILELNLIFND